MSIESRLCWSWIASILRYWPWCGTRRWFESFVHFLQISQTSPNTICCITDILRQYMFAVSYSDYDQNWLLYIIIWFLVSYVAICLATLFDRPCNRRRVFTVPNAVAGRIIRRLRPVAIVVACFIFTLLCNEHNKQNKWKLSWVVGNFWCLNVPLVQFDYESNAWSICAFDIHAMDTNKNSSEYHNLWHTVHSSCHCCSIPRSTVSSIQFQCHFLLYVAGLLINLLAQLLVSESMCLIESHLGNRMNLFSDPTYSFQFLCQTNFVLLIQLG